MTEYSIQYSNIRFYPGKIITINVFAIVSVVLLLLSVYTRSAYVALLFFAVLPIGLWKPQYLIPVFFISSLSSDYFVAAEGIGFTRIIAVVIIAGVLFRFFRCGETIVNSKWNLNCMLIIIASMISFLFAYDDDIGVLYSPLFNILIFISITNLKLNNEELVRLFRAMLFAVLITIIFIVVTLADNPQMLLEGRLKITDDLNENRFGMMFAQLSAYSAAYLFFSKNSYVRILCFVAFFTSFFLLLASGSRSALLGVVLGSVSSILITSYFRKQIIKILITLAVVSAAIAVMFNMFLDSNPMLASRMNIEQGISSQKIEGGRLHRIVAEMQYVIPDHPFFGVGPASINETIGLSRYNVSDPGSSHNIIISLLAQMGFIGFVAYMSLFGRIIKNAISKLQTQEIVIIPLMLVLTAIFNGVGEVMYSERLLWNNLALAALCLSMCPNVVSPLPSKISSVRYHKVNLNKWL